jgi:large subunit ribosomal protein L4
MNCSGKHTIATCLTAGPNSAATKTRGEVRGGGRKPWRQKGTGRARFGSIRNPIWRGGGIAFGPTGEENYRKKMHTRSKRKALRQALSIALDSDKLMIIESFDPKLDKTKAAAHLLDKIGVSGKTLLVVQHKKLELARAINNLPEVNIVQAQYLNVYDLLNADSIIIEKAALTSIEAWLGGVE